MNAQRYGSSNIVLVENNLLLIIYFVFSSTDFNAIL